MTVPIQPTLPPTPAGMDNATVIAIANSILSKCVHSIELHVFLIGKGYLTVIPRINFCKYVYSIERQMVLIREGYLNLSLRLILTISMYTQEDFKWSLFVRAITM